MSGALPWADWQFWVVTATAMGGLWTLIRPLLPLSKKDRGACSHCAAGAAACKKPVPGAGGRGEAAGPELVQLGSSEHPR